MNTALLKLGARVWLIETIVTGFNFFVLMGFIYEPLWGELAAHQIGCQRGLCTFLFLHILCFATQRNTKLWT